MTRGHSPSTLNEALSILNDQGGNAVPVAGCTDLMVIDYATGRSHAAVVNILGLKELAGIHRTEEWVDIGAASTFTEIRNHPDVQSVCPILAEVAATVGAWQIQNRATIGGNIANASPAGDSLPVLLALDAQCVVAGTNGERVVDYADMHVAYRKTALAPGELIVRVRIPVGNANRIQQFRKVGTRRAQAISKVLLAMTADRDGDQLANVRIGAGSVAAIPMRLVKTEASLNGQVPDLRTADAAAAVARDEVQPIDDVRSTADYRKFVLGRLVRRMVLHSGTSG
ncbi:MAG: carbon monoxide dehydrogenase [Myxococcales bacterium]|nr:carbon monoxide dehydrogenase [Myxococcales bacterium]